MADETDLVHVVLIDTATGATVADDHIPANLMPETFANPTTLHLGGADWTVERAEPVTRAELLASGALTVWMREVQRVPLDQILYSLPTLETLQPPFDPAPAAGAQVWMHEDDWRQHELVAARFASAIAAELAEVRAIRATQRSGAGFRTLHVRTRIPEPLAGTTLTLAELGLDERRPIALGPARGPGKAVASGFAAVSDGCEVYGRVAAGQVVALGLRSGIPGQRLAAVAVAHGLVLVDWIATTVARPDGERFVTVPR